MLKKLGIALKKNTWLQLSTGETFTGREFIIADVYNYYNRKYNINIAA